MKYRVYKNLHNGKWSIANNSTGIVVGHADSVTLYDVTYKVSKAGRQRVIKEGKKNVHAFIVGYVGMMDGFTPYKGREVVQIPAPDFIYIDRAPRQLTYNPYLYDSFVYRDSLTPVEQRSNVVLLAQKSVTVF